VSVHAEIERQVFARLEDAAARAGPREAVGIATPLEAVGENGKMRKLTKDERLAFVLAALRWGRRVGRKLDAVRIVAGGQVGLVFLPRKEAE